MAIQMTYLYKEEVRRGERGVRREKGGNSK
jgi:hypothetical protein